MLSMTCESLSSVDTRIDKIVMQECHKIFCLKSHH